LCGLRRNIAIAMGNSGRAAFLPKLREWLSSADKVVADAAGWAIAHIEDSLAGR